MSIQLVVVDDQEMIRHGVRELTAGTDIRIVGEAETETEAVRLAVETKPDVVLVDVRLAKGDGLSTLGHIKQQAPELNVLLFSAFRNPLVEARGVALGASGFLSKDAVGEEFLAAIRTVARGEQLWTRASLRRVAGSLAAPRIGTDIETPLTGREMQVLRLVTSGMSNRSIAEALGISSETVKEHMQHILRKSGLRDRTQAAIWAVQMGLV